MEQKTERREKTYFMGDRAEYTGESRMLHGGLFFALLMLDGHLNGEERWTTRAPKQDG